MGFKNARKATSYAAEAAAEKLAVDARRLGFGQVNAACVCYYWFADSRAGFAHEYLLISVGATACERSRPREAVGHQDPAWCWIDHHQHPGVYTAAAQWLPAEEEAPHLSDLLGDHVSLLVGQLRFW
jgi:hypothetical protein